MKAKTKYEAEGTVELMRDLRGLAGVDSDSIDAGWRPEDWIVAHFDTVMEAINRIESGPVLIHGDYDADGLCATAIAKLAMPHAGIYLPSREDGYGVNDPAMYDWEDNELIFTVDCGISNINDMEEAEKNGKRFIVTDHHEPPSNLSMYTFPVVNPKHTDIGYKGLSGSGVALLFFKQLGLLQDDVHATQLAAIGTMSDMMPMLQWNRPLIRLGLRNMRVDPCPGVKAMARACNMNLRYITEETLSWYFGPILNSAGRLGHLYAAEEMLYTTDYDRAYEIAKFLKKEKDQEKKNNVKLSKKVAKEAGIFEHEGIVVVDVTRIPKVATGTVANHIQNEYGKPALVYGMRDGLCTGSFRCQESFDAPALIQELIDRGLAVGGGGHKAAAGLQWVQQSTVETLDYIEDYANKALETWVMGEFFDADVEMPLDAALTLFEAFDQLRPYGMGFEKPTFLSKITAFDDYRYMGKKKEHCAFRVFNTDVVAFGLADKIPENANSLMVVYEISRNASNFGDAGEIQVIVRDVEVLS